MLARTTRVFLETTSIRGVGKIVKTQNSFLSRLWILFVVASSSLLFYSVGKITSEFLQYDVNIQTHLGIDDATPFPAVSICNNQPFSKRAYRLWSANAVKSPTQFNRELRQQADDILNVTKLVAAYQQLQEALGDGSSATVEKERSFLETASRLAMMNTIVLDNARIYYQNLPANESLLLGHSRDESIIDCIFRYGQVQVQGTKGCIDDVIEVTEFSHPNFFNCMTLQFKPSIAQRIFSLTLIIWLGPDENYDIRSRQAFLYDVFEQAYGLRVAIHEPGTPPRILEQGMQTEPGKMNEIKYRPVRFVRENTPKHPCAEAESQLQRFRDLHNWYGYDLELCLNSRVQQTVMQQCGCMYIELPRVSVPNSSHPYCGRVDQQLYSRSRCVSGIDQRRIRKSFEGSACLPRCSDLTFSKELSMTKWRDTQWMLYWIKEISDRWNAHFQNVRFANASRKEFLQDIGRVKQYLQMPNVTDIRRFANSSSASSFKFDDRYTFLVVKRESNNTLVKSEKIVLTLNALFSRIGGLCSMYIGLTLAFFVECIELVYKLLCEKAPAESATKSASKSLEAEDNAEQLGLMRLVETEEQKGAADAGDQQAFVWLRQSDQFS